MLLTLISKKKIQHFVYVHVLLILGLVVVNPSWASLITSLLVFLLILAPAYSVITHLNFTHNYIKFRNVFYEWVAIILLAVYSFWQLREVKSYHILHHAKWKTSGDPTASEVRQGWIKYYIGNTDPCAINLVETQESFCINSINKHFYTIKLITYSILLLLGGFECLWYSVFLMQFFLFFFSKIHDVMFHYSDNAKNKAWLFPIYFNDSWHVDHHIDYEKLESWKCRYINMQFWAYKLFFKPA